MVLAWQKDENAPTLVKKKQQQWKLELELTDYDEEQVYYTYE